MRRYFSWLLIMSMLLGAGLQGAALAASPAVTLDAVGGSFEGGSGAMELDLLSATQLPTPRREGFAFGGWFTKEDGQGDALRLPREPGQDAQRYLARWVPLKDSDLFTVSILWVDSTGQAAPGYCYRFLDQASGAQIDLPVEPVQDLDPQAQVARYTAKIHLPKAAPDGSPAVYGTVADEGYGIVWQEGIPYTASYREALVRGEGSADALYFQRERLFRRMIHPTLSVRFEGVSPSDLSLTLSAQPAFGSPGKQEVSATLPSASSQSGEVSLLDLLTADRGKLLDFAWDEVDYLLNYQGHNQYALSAAAPEGSAVEITGDALKGFTLTIRKP